MHFHTAHNWMDFWLIWNILCLSTSTLVVWYFPTHNKHIWRLLLFNWFSMPCKNKCQGCFQSRHVMTVLTLGQLAVKYTNNIFVHISFNVLLEFAFVADQLKCFMYTLIVMCTTILCKTFFSLFTQNVFPEYIVSSLYIWVLCVLVYK